jgi:glycine dehydrogenase
MIMSLTAMDIANSSLLDEATAAAEAMVMALVAANHKRKTFFVDNGVLPQTLAVLKTRAKGFDIRLVVGDASTALSDEKLRSELCGVLLHYSTIDGQIKDFKTLVDSVHDANALVAVATDLLALTMLKPPGEWGADMVLGNSARFGVPAGYGGPHGAFFACTDKLKRKMPGRIIGRSRDVRGLPAYRLALQSKYIFPFRDCWLIKSTAREQHIRREKATSNICTSQALLANMAAMYAVYHGPEGLRRIANKVHGLTQLLKVIVEGFGYRAIHQHFFDTLTLDVTGAVPSAQFLHAAATTAGINLRTVDDEHVGITLDESVGPVDFLRIVNAFSASVGAPLSTAESLPVPVPTSAIPESLKRTSEYLPHPVFNKHHSETEMLRYIHHLQSKDLSLVHSMTPLGSCTMKLNSTSSMIPLTWPEFGAVHPYSPLEQVKGYSKIISVCDRPRNRQLG